MIELQVTHTGTSTGSEKIDDSALHDADAEPKVTFVGTQNWKSGRPRTLVVACSDGRLQESTDEFLEKTLGVTDYDRLYAPGGPGAVASGTGDVKTDQFRRDMQFLMEAHKIEDVVLLFHGAERSGPDDAMCAHYNRILPGAARRTILHKQRSDAAEALAMIASIAPKVKVHVYRAEVRADTSVHFVDLLKRK